MSASVTQATAILTGFLVEHSGEMIMILATRHSGQNIASGGINRANLAVEAIIGRRD
jgi:hypothetical protein